MNSQILEVLEQNPVTQEILKASDHVGNLSDMEEALLLWAAWKQDGKGRIIVKKNKYEARQLYARLSMLAEDSQLFVMDESLRVSAIASSPEEREEQIRALDHLIEKPNSLVVANAAAFLRFLPDRKLFENLCFTLKEGQEITMNELKEKLEEAGYARVNYVERPGSYASRGGIVDIYSLNHDQPVRIEFFDTEIDSIRFFDAQTQRTITSIPDVRIIPASDILFTKEQKETLDEQVSARLETEAAKLPAEAADQLRESIEQDLMDLRENNMESRLYRYYAWNPSASILDYSNSQIIFSSQEDVEEFAKKLLMDNSTYMQEEVQDHNALPKYTMFHDLHAMAQKRKPVYFHNFVSFENPTHSDIHPIEPPTLNYKEWLPAEAAKENVWLALEEEDKRILKDHMDISSFRFEEPVFFQGFEADGITIYTRREIFRHLNRHTPYQKTFSASAELSNLLELEPGDYIVHAQYGIGQYVGVVTRVQNGVKADYLHIVYRDGDDLYVPLSQYQSVRKYISKEGAGTKLSKLDSGQWEKTKEKVSQRVEEIAGRLVDLYAARTEEIGFAFPKDSALEQEFDESFEYESTPDQLRATAEIKAEMEKPKPMDHLLIGDVGFGKTEVAMRCAFKAIAAGKQVAFLCPTTVLSLQHYQTLSKRFEETGARIELVNRFISEKEMKDIRQGLKDGQVDIVVGTHRLFNKNIEFKDLGLLIIDEEQRFGVEHKEKIKEMKNSIDVLSLSATPIPRTLQMSLIGVRSISQLNTPPARRLPIQTYVMEKKGKVVDEIIERELARDGQVFYLHNRVQDIYAVAKDLQSRFPDVEIGVAHGRMSREEIEDVMLDFAMNKYQILVCTTIIETGLDIANANTIIIENADRFGLSQLYQIRGRVGRRDRLAYCYLMVSPQKQLNEEAAKRLKSIKEFTQLGSGYKIAMRDLTIRGAGDMLGPQQAGFIDSVGLDLYLDMLSEAIARKQGKKKDEEPVPTKTAKIQTGGYIPGPFTDHDGDKLELYQEIKSAKNLKELEALEEKTADLFGTIPKEVRQIFESRRLDLFVSQPTVESMQESKNNITIVMSEDYSLQVDGIRLFEAMSAVSKSVQLAYRNRKVQVSFVKKKNYLSLLLKVIDVLNNPDYRKTK